MTAFEEYMELNNRLHEIEGIIHELEKEKKAIKQRMIDEDIDLPDWFIKATNSYDLNKNKAMELYGTETFDKFFKRVVDVKVKPGKHETVMEQFPQILKVKNIVYKLMKRK